MKPRFADSFYYLALLNPKDEAHARSAALTRECNVPVVTTTWVLTEVADALAAPKYRAGVSAFFRLIEKEPNTSVVEPSMDLFRRGMDLYARRPDKRWSLTDCISFFVMERDGIREALTADHHFEQAGFVPLLK